MLHAGVTDRLGSLTGSELMSGQVGKRNVCEQVLRVEMGQPIAIKLLYRPFVSILCSPLASKLYPPFVSTL